VTTNYETEKKEADTLYLNKNFESALKKYLSILVDNPKPAIYLNISAVLIEQQNYLLALIFSTLAKSHSEITFQEKARSAERQAISISKLSLSIPNLFESNPDFKPLSNDLDDENIEKQFNIFEDSLIKDFCYDFLKNSLISSSYSLSKIFDGYIKKSTTIIQLISLNIKQRIKLAIYLVKQGLLESRSRPLLKLLNSLSASLEETFLSKEDAEKLRTQGNDQVKESNWVEAEKLYTEALKCDPDDYRIYSNRSLCYTKLMAWGDAIRDCEKTIELAPKGFLKPYLRLSSVYCFLRMFHRALGWLQKVPENFVNQDIVREKTKVLSQAMEFNRRDEKIDKEAKERIEKAQADPNVQEIMKEPELQKVMMEMQRGNMSLMSKVMSDKNLKDKMEYLMAAGIVRYG